MSDEYRPWDMDQKTFLLLMHLSQLANFVIPLGGVILPLVMWATNKDESSEIDRHGKVILNWIFSAIIYSFVCWLLIFILVGFILLPILALLDIAFVIIGAIKANEGQLWHYPLSIKFFTVN